MRLVFIGPPGSGKGTQSKRLLAYLGVPHLSTGEMLRRAIANRESEGVVAEHYMSQGKLVPDEIVMRIVEKRLQQQDCCSQGCLFDGFPRTLPQAAALDELLCAASTPLDSAIELQANEDELMRRMLYRASVERRPDDTPQTVARRLDVYRQQTAPLIDYYRRQGKLISIDAMRSPDEVFADIQRAVDRGCPETEGAGVSDPAPL
jgi:adenylate kinase